MLAGKLSDPISLRAKLRLNEKLIFGLYNMQQEYDRKHFYKTSFTSQILICGMGLAFEI